MIVGYLGKNEKFLNLAKKVVKSAHDYEGDDVEKFLESGNHDSTGFLDAPKELLNRMNITIIGKALKPESCWLSFGNNDDKVHIAAVPFLRNSDFPPANIEAGVSIKERNFTGVPQGSVLIFCFCSILMIFQVSTNQVRW